MILDETDERLRTEAAGRCAPVLLLPRVTLALVKVAILHRRDELLRRAPVIAVGSQMVPGQRDNRRVVQIVVPETVKSIAALGTRTCQPRLLFLILRHEKNRA